jgi:hypothetical protein
LSPSAEPLGISVERTPLAAVSIALLSEGRDMADILARIDALLANTPPSEVEEFEVCRCLRDAKAEIERLRLTPDERQAITFLAHTDERQQWVRRSRLAFKSSLCRLLQRTKCATH